MTVGHCSPFFSSGAASLASRFGWDWLWTFLWWCQGQAGGNASVLGFLMDGDHRRQHLLFLESFTCISYVFLKIPTHLQREHAGETNTSCETNQLLLISWQCRLNLASPSYQIATTWQMLHKKNNGSDSIRQKALLESFSLKKWKGYFSKWWSVLVNGMQDRLKRVKTWSLK